MSPDFIMILVLRTLVCILTAITWLLLPPDVRLMVLAAAVFGIYHHRAFHVPFAEHHQQPPAPSN